MRELGVLLLILLVVSVLGRIGDLPEHRKLRRALIGMGIKDRYIVVLNPKISNVLEKARSLLMNSGAILEYTYVNSIKGFTCSSLAYRFLMSILDDDLVEYVEQVS
jgi:hypothetical protein